MVWFGCAGSEYEKQNTWCGISFFFLLISRHKPNLNSFVLREIFRIVAVGFMQLIQLGTLNESCFLFGF